MRRKHRSFQADQFRRQTQARLIGGGLGILLVVGGGLVWLLYGGTAAVTTVSCLLTVAGVFGFLWLILGLVERWVEEDEP